MAKIDKIKFLNSNLETNVSKLVSGETAIVDGELALVTEENKERLYIKNTDGVVVPIHNIIDGGEIETGPTFDLRLVGLDHKGYNGNYLLVSPDPNNLLKETIVKYPENIIGVMDSVYQADSPFISGKPANYTHSLYYEWSLPDGGGNYYLSDLFWNQPPPKNSKNGMIYFGARMTLCQLKITSGIFPINIDSTTAPTLSLRRDGCSIYIDKVVDTATANYSITDYDISAYNDFASKGIIDPTTRCLLVNNTDSTLIVTLNKQKVATVELDPSSSTSILAKSMRLETSFDGQDGLFKSLTITEKV